MRVFCSPHDAGLFFEKFQVVYDIAQIIKAIFSEDASVKFRTEIFISLLAFCSAQTRSFSSKTEYAISQFSNAVSKSYVSKKEEVLPNNELTLLSLTRQLFDTYVEFYHEVNVHEQLLAPSKKELKRRGRISDTKRHKNSQKSDARESMLEMLKKSKGKNESQKDACSRFFVKNQSELKEIGITSPWTLENLCSRRGNRKSPSYLRSLRNSIDVLTPISEPILCEKLGITLG